jgi:AraC-like DNA-binding protein
MVTSEVSRGGSHVKGRFQSELLSKYIRINFLVIFLPIIVATSVYWIIIQKNYTEQYLETIEYTSMEDLRGIEELMRSFRAVAMQISFDRELSPYHLTNSKYISVQAIEKLGYYSKGSQYLDELAIYLNDSDKIYTTKGAVDIDVFLAKSYRASGTYTAPALRELIEARGYFGTTMEGEYVLGPNTSRYRVITYPLEKIRGNPFGALIGFYPDNMEERFADSADSKRNSHITLLCTNAMLPIYSKFPVELEELKQEDTLKETLNELYSQWDGEHENYEVKFGNRVFIGKVVHSEVNGWYLIDMVDKLSISRNIFMLQLPMIVLMAVSLLVLTILLSVVLSVYNYLPIQRLYSLFDKNQEKKQKKKRNELLYLNDYIRELMAEQDDIEEQLDTTRHIGRMGIVKRLLRGNLDLQAAVVRSQMESLEISLDGEYLTAIVVKTTKDRPKGFMDLLGKALFKLNRKGFYLTDMIYKDYFAFLACPEHEDEILPFAEEILDLMGEGADYLHIGIGSSYRSPESLKYSLMEAIIAVEGSENSVNIFSDNPASRGEELYWKPLPGEIKLKQALLQGMEKDLDSVVDELYQQLLHIAQSHSDTVLQFVMNRVFISLFEVSQCIRVTGAERFLHYTEPGEFCEQLRTFCQMEMESQIAKKAAQSEARMQNIMQFIDENYDGPEMSLTLVAEKFDMTSSYLSRIFKACAGENFIDYITGKRLEKAASLLKSTDYSISRIVEMVGYSDSASFTRKFTRHYFMSPGNYRKVNQEK